MMKILGFLLILLSPLCLGLPWVPLGGAKHPVTRVCFACLAGHFMRLTLFHAVALPMTLFGGRFSVMSNVFTALLVAACLASAWLGKDALRVDADRQRLTVYEFVYLAVFIALLLAQLVLTVVMDPTTMTYDDASYLPYSGDALATDYMFITRSTTGTFKQLSYRAIQSALLFPAYITRMTGVALTMVDRTLCYALNLLLAYGCYAYMAEDLYKKNEDRLIFLILLSVLYIFGFYSHYSMTFRLLGPNSQGKAVLAVILVPLLFVLLRKKLAEKYDRRFGVFLLLLSDAACSLSLMGAAYVPGIVLPLTVMSMFGRNRRWERLWYVAWASVMPCIYAVAYLLDKNYI